MKSIPSPSFLPPTDDREAWNEAAWRVRCYLASLDIEDEMDLFLSQGEILGLAIQEHAKNPKLSPVEHAYVQMRVVLANELQKKLLSDNPESNGNFWERMLAFKVAQCQEFFFTHIKRDPAFSSGDRKDLFTFSTLDLGSMTARPIDYGPLPELALRGQTQWQPILYAFIFWAIIYVIGHIALIIIFHD